MGDAKPDESTDQDFWGDDLLGRKGEAIFVLNLLRGKLNALPEGRRHFVLNISADWGHGKTFFLERLARQMAKDGHIVARVDAWETDYAADPLLPVMAAIEDAVSSLMNKNAGAMASAGGTLTKIRNNAGAIALAAGAAAGRGLINRWVPGLSDDVGNIVAGGKNKGTSTAADLAEDVVEAAIVGGAYRIVEAVLDKEAKSAVDGFRQTAKSAASFKRDLADLLRQAEREADVPLPLYVIVDELDRCRPTYAIALLERIKHLFNVDNVVFITGTAGRQLSSSIAAVYGQNFDAWRYLHRFFDRTYQLAEPLPRPLIAKFVKDQKSKLIDLFTLPEVSTEDYLNDVFTAFEFGARDIYQTLDLLQTVFDSWGVRQMPAMLILVPLACCHHTGKVGSDWSSMVEVAIAAMSRLEKRLTQFGPSSPTYAQLLTYVLEMASLPHNKLRNTNYEDNARGWVQDLLVRDFDGSRPYMTTYRSLLSTAGRVS